MFVGAPSGLSCPPACAPKRKCERRTGEETPALDRGAGYIGRSTGVTLGGWRAGGDRFMLGYT